MKRKWTILALVVGMMGALLATAGIAAGAGEDPVDVVQGVLLLNTDDGVDGYWVGWYESIDDFDYAFPTAVQDLEVDDKCKVTVPSGEPNLLTITASGGNFGIGAVSHGLGVRTKNNCSTAQGLIELGQKLTFSLGTYFSEGTFIKSAELDVEGKRNAKLGVTYLPSGVQPEPIILTFTSDNGPDSGIGDNNIAILGPGTPSSREIEVYPFSAGTNDAAVAIEGGGDGFKAGGVLRSSLNVKESLFELVGFDGILDCGFETFQANPDFPAEMDGIFKRLDNISGVCIPKPYNLNVTLDEESDSTTLLFDPEGDQDAAYSGKVSAPVKDGMNPTGATLRYDPTGGFDFEDMQWCTSDLDNPITFDEDGYVLTALLPGTESWCIAAENTVAVGGGDIRTTWTVYGHDDPRMSGG